MNIFGYHRPIPSRVWSLLYCCLLLINSNGASADSDKLHISTDIAPIHSLVSLVVGDQSNVDLIVPPSQSPHDFSLKPSQLRALNKADLIVVVSDRFSPSLSRHLKALGTQDVVLDLSKENQKDTELAHEHGDVHTWLNPEYAINWLEPIAQAIAAKDEPNRATYERNAMNAIDQLSALHITWKAELETVRDVPYIVHHDAYQHFAQSFELTTPQAIALSDARAPSAAKLKQIRLAALNTNCIFSEVQHNDAMVATVSAGLGLKHGVLDPLGSDIPLGPNLYATLIQKLTQSFSACLSP